MTYPTGTARRRSTMSGQPGVTMPPTKRTVPHFSETKMPTSVTPPPSANRLIPNENAAARPWTVPVQPKTAGEPAKIDKSLAAIDSEHPRIEEPLTTR